MSTSSEDKPLKHSMIPLHIKLSEEMYILLTQVAKNHGFPRIQGLIRYYIRRGLDAENMGYRLKEDLVFINKLKRQGVSDEIIMRALTEGGLSTSYKK